MTRRAESTISTQVAPASSGEIADYRSRDAGPRSFRCDLALLGMRLSSHLSLRANQRLAAGFARVAIHMRGRARDSILTNLRLCFPDMPDDELRLLARESMAEGLAAMLELGPLWSWERERVLSLVREVEGMDELEAALAQGRGTLLLGPHLGAWEVVGLFVSAQHPMTSLYRPSRARALDPHLCRSRERFGARLVPADSGGVRALFRTLRRGGVVGILPDQNPGPGAGVLAPFFGVPARTSTLAARLLASTDAVPLLAWAERLPRGEGFRLHFVPVDTEAMRSSDAESATCLLNQELERVIRSSPSQYLWSYRRFRHGAPGAQCPYAATVGLGAAPEGRAR